MWGARGPFLSAAAMVVAVVTTVVFVLRLLKNAIKTLSLVVCNQILYSLLYIVKHIAIHVMLIVAWPEPKPFGPMESQQIGYFQKALVMARTIDTLY
jgi:hypothetical protein